MERRVLPTPPGPADFPAFQQWNRDCPNARKTAASLVLLPTYPRYGLGEVDANVRVIREYFGAR
jgi:hypothetical protein